MNNYKFHIGDIVGKDLHLYPHNIGTICDVDYLDSIGVVYLVQWRGQITRPKVWYYQNELELIKDIFYNDFRDKIRDRMK